MKIKYKKILKPLVNIHFLKNQFYKQVVNSKSLNTITLELKQILKIIYLYNKNKKKILLIGFPYNKVIQNQTRHCFSSKNLYLKKRFNFKQFDLIVFNKTNQKDENILSNFIKLNIPIITLGECYKSGYNLNIVCKKKSIKNFNFFLIFSILTKYVK